MALFKRTAGRKKGDGKNTPESLDWKEKNRVLIETIHAGDIEGALLLGQEMVDYVDRVHRKDAKEKATTYNNMGMVFMMNRDYELADECFRDALAMRKRLFGADHNEVGVVLLNLAELYRRQASEILTANKVETFTR